jgi:hypothetical protein
LCDGFFSIHSSFAASMGRPEEVRSITVGVPPIPVTVGVEEWPMPGGHERPLFVLNIFGEGIVAMI